MTPAACGMLSVFIFECGAGECGASFQAVRVCVPVCGVYVCVCVRVTVSVSDNSRTSDIFRSILLFDRPVLHMCGNDVRALYN